LLAGIVLLVGTGIWIFACGIAMGHVGYDFRSAYLDGAHAIAAGRDPYAVLLQQTPDTRAGSAGLQAHGYVYPPLLATILAVPVRLGLSDGAMWLLWNLANVVFAVWMGRELNLALRGRTDWLASLLFATATLIGAVVMYDLYLGQADLLMAALAVIACGLWLRGNRWAPVVLGAAIAVKPTMGLLLLVWLYKGDWRAALRAAGAAVALLLLPFVLIGPHALLTYLTFMTGWNGLNASAEYINQSLYGMILRLVTTNAYVRPLLVAPALVMPLRLLAIAGVISVWVRAVPRAMSKDRALALCECLLALPLILLVSPLAEDIHYCLLMPALVALAWLAYARGWARTPTAMVLYVTLAALCIPRMQELIYPDHLFPFPGQNDPRIGWLVLLARSGTLLYTALATLLAGAGVLRQAHSGNQLMARVALRTADARNDISEMSAASERRGG
jgi:hypothetical protein